MLAFLAFVIAGITYTRTVRTDNAGASAEATIVIATVGDVRAQAEMLYSIFSQSDNDPQKANGIFRNLINSAQLPPLSPTHDELDSLARTGDETAGLVALCVKWRNIAQAYIPIVVMLNKENDSRLERVEGQYLHQVSGYLFDTFQACSAAEVALRQHAFPDPRP